MLQKPMKNESSNGSLEKYGFSCERGSAHMARTMMLLELHHLLDAVPASPGTWASYVQAIEEDNCLGKRSHRNRVLTRRHLTDLYGLSSDTTLFRNLRYFWQRDPEGRPLIAALCAYARDPLLRATAPFVLMLLEGQVFSREALEDYLEKKYPGRFSEATLVSTSQNLASSWTQTGHLSGRVKKLRSKANPTAGAAAYALLLGFLSGERGESLFKTDFAKLLDCSFEESVELAETASRRGWIVFKRVSNVIEVLFPSLLTQQEMEWIHEQN
jgi:hypothetical protein